MNTIQSMAVILSSPRAANPLLGVAGKSFLILGAALLLALLFRRAAAATRHFLWLGVLASLLLLPVVALVAPHWNSPKWAGAILHRWTPDGAGNSVPALVVGPLAAPGESQARPAVQQSGVHSPAPLLPGAPSFSWHSILGPAWAAGVAITTLVFVWRRWQLRRIEQTARPVTHPQVLSLFDSILAELRLQRHVRLLQTSQPLMPMTWGFWRPAALLPPDAAHWDRERLRLVLRHELAHVRRGDCLTQSLAALVCALYWFNPLVWLAAARMRVERERACDDLAVASGGMRPSDYAGQLLGIARQFSAAPSAALPVAKRSGLERRLRALLDGARDHGQLTRRSALTVTCALAVSLVCLAGWRVAASDAADSSAMLRQQLIARIKTFSALKEKQSERLAAATGGQISPDFKAFFDAAIRGDGQYVTNRFAFFQQTNSSAIYLRHVTSYWEPVREICLACGPFGMMAGEPKYELEFGDGIIQSIPAGSIYFGGTDAGRGLVTALCKSQPDADPFFTLTQNALADNSYLDYLRGMYGGRIYVPSGTDAENVFSKYLQDVQRRFQHDMEFPKERSQMDPDEHYTNIQGRVQVGGTVAVMKINGLLAKIIFDRNPDRQFYIEQSFALDWMHPYLEPHGLIMKINRDPLPTLPQETMDKDHAFWSDFSRRAIGNWITYDTTVKEVCDWAEAVYVRHDLSHFTGDPRFIRDIDTQKVFGKSRSSIAESIYHWRSRPENSRSATERPRLDREAEFAFKQAFAYCPSSPDTLFNFVNFLVSSSPSRIDDAISILQTCHDLDPGNEQVTQWIDHLKQRQRLP